MLDIQLALNAKKYLKAAKYPYKVVNRA